MGGETMPKKEKNEIPEIDPKTERCRLAGYLLNELRERSGHVTDTTSEVSVMSAEFLKSLPMQGFPA